MSERLIVQFAEFGNHLGDAAGSEMMRQAGYDAFLDGFSGWAAVAKAKSIQGRGHKGRIGGNEVERGAAHGFEEIADYNFQVGGARGLSVEGSAAGGTGTDIDGKHLLCVGGSEERMNARAGANVEGRAIRASHGTASKAAAIEANAHDLIVRNRSMPRVGKLGPGMIRKDQAIADGKQRCASPDESGLIDGEQPGSDEHVAVSCGEQEIEFVRRDGPLQEEEIDGQSKGIADGQALGAENGEGTPVEVAEIVQAKALLHEIFGVVKARELRNGVAKARYVGRSDAEGGGRHAG